MLQKIPRTTLASFFDLQGEEVNISLRDFGSYMKYNKECLHKGYKSSVVDTYLSAQLFAAPAAGQNRQKLAKINETGRFKKKNIEWKQLSILKRISNKIKENSDESYTVAMYNPGSRFQ
jgi:hypothetical protein